MIPLFALSFGCTNSDRPTQPPLEAISPQAPPLGWRAQSDSRVQSVSFYGVDNNALQSAAALIQSGKLREAELILVREAQKDVMHLGVRDALAATYVALAEQAISQNDIPGTDREIMSANATLLNIKSIAVTPGSPLPPRYAETIASRERQVRAVETHMKAAATLGCRTALAQAEGKQQAAYNPVGRNNRDEVIEGLRLTRRCVELQKWIDTDSRAAMNRQLDKLLAMVTEKEREAVLSAAGLGPVR